MKTRKIKKDTIISQLLEEHGFSTIPALIAVNGEVLPAMENRILKKGDKVNLLPIFDEG